METQPQQTVGKLEVELRTQGGKSVTRKIRAAGKIPAICYGKGEDPIPLSIDPKALLGALDADKRANTVITMKVTGLAGGPKDLTVMLRDWQRDVLKGNITHADFVRVRLDQDVHATVPIILTGKAEGVKLGGTLHQVYRSLEIACTPDKIPVKLEIAVDALGMGDALHVRDLKLPEGVRARLDGGATICTVTAPKAEKVAEPTAEAVAAEAAAAAAAPGATPAAGAAPAAGAKEGEKKADEKPAKKKKE
jgi:large subunit ribosomal protein L25